MKIHPTAVIDANAELAEDVEIQPFTIVGPHVSIGAGTVVGPHCVIDGRTEIGANNRFFSGAQVGVPSQDMKHDPGLVGRVSIGDGNCFREHVTISASTLQSDDEDHRVTSIGDSCLVMACAHVAHDCRVGSHVWMSNSTALAGHIVVEDHAILSGLVGVHQDCVIGAYAYVGGMSRIAQDVPPYMIVEGNPARCHGPNTVGLRRKGFDDAARSRIKQMFKIMYRADLNVTQALHEIEQTVEESPDRTHFVEFFRKSIRGVIR